MMSRTWKPASEVAIACISLSEATLLIYKERVDHIQIYIYYIQIKTKNKKITDIELYDISSLTVLIISKKLKYSE